MGQITVKLTGVKEIQRTLRLTEREMKKILRAAASKTGQRMRHVQKKQLRSRGVSPRATRSRSHGSRDSAWIGANPVLRTRCPAWWRSTRIPTIPRLSSMAAISTLSGSARKARSRFWCTATAADW